jgi:5'-nucleotidase/UDP-sugar diphosphatase
VEQMNALGYSAWSIGNHEFDWGPDTLARRVRELRSAALAANLRERPSGRRPSWARPDTVVSRRGVRIAVLGLCNPHTPTLTLARNVASFTFEDDSATAAPLAGTLRRGARADVVVGLAHAPATMDSSGRIAGDLARLARVPGVDLWLGGHSHTRVNGEVAGIPVLIPGSRGEMVAVCDLVVDPVRHRVVERHARLETTWANRVIPDSAMAALVERARSSVAARAAEPVGRTLHRLSRSRTGESTLGDLVSDVLRRATGADIALQNSGALRADVPAGTITRGMIYDALPFENTLVTLELNGREVRQAIEEGLRSERITQVSGIGYVFDLGAPAGARVRSIVDSRGAPLDSARTYRVVCNDFMAGGGDGYVTLTRGRNGRDTGLSLRDRVEAAIREASQNGALDVSVDGRVSRAAGSPSPSRGED